MPSSQASGTLGLLASLLAEACVTLFPSLFRIQAFSSKNSESAEYLGSWAPKISRAIHGDFCPLGAPQCRTTWWEHQKESTPTLFFLSFSYNGPDYARRTKTKTDASHRRRRSSSPDSERTNTPKRLITAHAIATIHPTLPNSRHPKDHRNSAEPLPFVHAVAQPQRAELWRRPHRVESTE